jgi:hypothetical protein
MRAATTGHRHHDIIARGKGGGAHQQLLELFGQAVRAVGDVQIANHEDQLNILKKYFMK